MTVSQPSTAARPRQSTNLSSGRKTKNAFMGFLIALGTICVVAPLILIFGFLLYKGVGALNLSFFTKTPAPEGEAGGGWANAITGSLMILGIATVIGVIIGVAGGLFLAEFPRHKLMRTIRSLSDILSGIPAIVMGLVVYALVVKPMGHFSALAGGIALGLLMIPIVVRTTEEVLKLVPLSVREAGLALGLPQWKVIMSVVLPAASSGIITGIILAVSRVAGEAAPLLFTAFGSNLINYYKPLQPASALPLEIYKGATSAFEENQRMAQAGALLLILLIFLASMLARFMNKPKQ